jgi:hypothetical protein
VKMKWMISLLLCSSPAAAGEWFWQEVAALSDQTMSNVRGGFALDIGQINIGISVTGSVDGTRLLNSHIANLTIANGKLLGSKDLSNTIQLLQVGEGNFATISSSLVGTQGEDENLPQANANQLTNIVKPHPVIGNIIQNTADGRLIELTTMVDIEANVSTLIDREALRAQIRDSIRINLGQ